MTLEDLSQARAARWAALRPAVVTPASLRRWVREIGFPTLHDLGEDAAAPLEDALASAQLIELWLWPGEHRYCAAEVLPWVAVSRGAGKTKTSMLAAEVLKTLQGAAAALTSSQVRDCLGAERTSALTVEHACHELARCLLVLRTGRDAGGAPLWRPVASLFPGLAENRDRISQNEAAAALLTQFLDVQVCESEELCAEFFTPLLARHRIHSALLGLEAAHRVTLDSLEGRPAWRLLDYSVPA